MINWEKCLQNDLVLSSGTLTHLSDNVNHKYLSTCESNVGPTPLILSMCGGGWRHVSDDNELFIDREWSVN